MVIILVQAAVNTSDITEVFLYVTGNINSISKIKNLSTTEYVMKNSVSIVLGLAG